mgnify:CR=1 FL=1
MRTGEELEKECTVDRLRARSATQELERDS